MAVSDTSALHAEAVSQGRESYVDPDTGYRVITELGHLRRGKCCGCGCRHCPFEYESVPEALRAARAQAPALVHREFFERRSCDVLFRSGGKDSYLAWRYLKRELAGLDRDIVLLTTFDARSRTVAHQEIPFPRILEQSEALGAPLPEGVDAFGERGEFHTRVSPGPSDAGESREAGARGERTRTAS